MSLKSLLRQLDGPLTRELVRQPGRFGLTQLPQRLVPDSTTTSVCGFCSTGCALKIHLKDGVAVSLSPERDYLVNLGMACPKGWEALSVLESPDRATVPLLRNGSGKLASTSWDTALCTFVTRFKDIQRRHGPDSLAWLGTGQIVTEELALLGALAKFGMGIIHGDGNTRQCMATAVTAYRQSFGFDAPPYTYEDFEQSDVIVLIGSNLCVAHPILWERICRNPHRPEIVVVDPRRTETAMAATLHLPLRPKSDLALLYGIARLLIDRGAIDRRFIDAHTSNFDAFKEHVANFPPAAVASLCGISQDDLLRVARTIHEGKRVSFWWTMGVNQSYEGTRLAQSIINLALMTGNIGRPGTGANSITGQCNAMGSRLFSNTASLFAGRDFKSASDRADVASILNIDVANIPDRDSWPYHKIIDGVASGRIKGLWIIATNPSHSWIGQNDLHRMLRKLDFLVVQDMYSSTETALHADLVLPAAGWAEKEGTFINSERRIGVTRKVCRAPGEALADFYIFKLLADYWGCGEMFRRWDSPQTVFQILKALSRSRPCDITGIADYAMLERCSGVQWPFSECDARQGAPAPQRRLFEGGRFYHADDRALFLFDAPSPMPERPDASYPFVLLTGRGSASQWHTQTRTGKSAVLRQLSATDIYLEINPADARRLGIEPDEQVMVESRRGSLTARAFITPCVASGQVFVPMHYASANRLTDPVFDPHSHQPNYKSCAVTVRKRAHWER